MLNHWNFLFFLIIHLMHFHEFFHLLFDLPILLYEIHLRYIVNYVILLLMHFEYLMMIFESCLNFLDFEYFDFGELVHFGYCYLMELVLEVDVAHDGLVMLVVIMKFVSNIFLLYFFYFFFFGFYNFFFFFFVDLVFFFFFGCILEI